MVNQKNVRDTAEGFEGVETADNDAVLSHPPCTGGHRDSQYGNETLWNDGDGKSDGINSYFLVHAEPSGTKDDKCETTRVMRSFERIHG